MGLRAVPQSSKPKALATSCERADSSDSPSKLSPTNMKSKEIELTEASQEAPEPKVDVPITFCTHVGWDGAMLLLFPLAISGLFVYITFLYTKGFQAWHRPWVWVFMVLAGLYLLLVVKFLCTWEKIAGHFLKRENDRRPAVHVPQNCLVVYKNLQVDGPWFLLKLYASEVFDSIQQCINLGTIYLCSLPVQATSSICVLLSLECFFTGWTTTQTNTPPKRNRQLKIDIIVDFLCVALPLSTVWFVYQMPISIVEMIQITVVPTMFTLAKMDDLLEENIRQHCAAKILRTQAKLSMKWKRRRESLFQQPAYLIMAKRQELILPPHFKTIASGLKVLFGLFFTVVAIAHIAMEPSGCDEIWSKGCVSKIPFCTKLFTPSCNCASLKIENDKSLVTLPDLLVDDMKGLRKMVLRNCNLTALPTRMEKLTEMVDVEVSFNRLQRFDVDVGKWKRLESLILDNNNITAYNDAIFTHDDLAYLDLSDNIGLEIQRTQSKVFMPSLLHLALANNSVEIDTTFDSKMFPRLLDLFLNGNTLKVFPDQSLQHSLQYLGVARCHLRGLPTYLKEFRYLKYLDARDNNISTVPEEIKALVKGNKVESYFADNPVCRVDKSLDCEPLCSKYCWIRDEPGNGFCDFRCSSKACKYDGGDCE